MSDRTTPELLEYYQEFQKHGGAHSNGVEQLRSQRQRDFEQRYNADTVLSRINEFVHRLQKDCHLKEPMLEQFLSACNRGFDPKSWLAHVELNSVAASSTGRGRKKGGADQIGAILPHPSVAEAASNAVLTAVKNANALNAVHFVKETLQRATNSLS